MKPLQKYTPWIARSLTLLVTGLLFTSCVNVDKEVARRPSELWKPPAEAIQGGDIVVPGPRPSKASDLLGMKPLDLPTLLDISLENNPQTRASWYAAKAAAAEYGQSQSTYYPDVNFTASVGRQYTKNDFLPITENYTTYGPALTINYLLFNFGKRSATADAARESLYAANFAYNQTYQDIVQQVVNAYYDLHAANESLKATEASLENAEATFVAADTRLKSGLGTKQDMLRALADVKSVEAQLESDYANIETQRANLAASMGIKVGEYLQIEPPPAPPTFEGIDEGVSTLVALALQQRPDIMQAYATTRSAEYDLEAAKADLWPELKMQLDGSLTEFDGRGYNPTENFRAALVLEWDIFQGFNKKYTIEEARATLREQQADVLQQKLSVVSNVWTFYFTFRSAIKQVEAQQEALTAQQEAYDAIAIGYNTGINSLLDLLTAQQDLDTTRQLLVDAEATLADAIANLANAVGTLPQPAFDIEKRYAAARESREEAEAEAVDGYFRDDDPDPPSLEPKWMEEEDDDSAKPGADHAEGDEGTQGHDDGGNQGIHQAGQADHDREEIVNDREGEDIADGAMAPPADRE